MSKPVLYVIIGILVLLYFFDHSGSSIASSLGDNKYLSALIIVAIIIVGGMTLLGTSAISDITGLLIAVSIIVAVLWVIVSITFAFSDWDDKVIARDDPAGCTRYSQIRDHSVKAGIPACIIVEAGEYLNITFFPQSIKNRVILSYHQKSKDDRPELFGAKPLYQFLKPLVYNQSRDGAYGQSWQVNNEDLRYAGVQTFTILVDAVPR